MNERNTERVLITLIASAITAVGLWLGVDVQAVCEAVINGGI